jgi:hypothetical protein
MNKQVKQPIAQQGQSEAKQGHTKGPWTVTREGDAYLIAETFHRPQKEFEANATLIAAAPELLEALKAIYEHFNTKCKKEDHGPHYDSTGHIIESYCPRCDASARAHYAIAKAQGGAE